MAPPRSSKAVPGVTPEVRLGLVRDFAIMVFGKKVVASAWLGRVHANVLGGSCIVAIACQTPEGFAQAMAELARIHGQRQGGARPASGG